MRLVATFLSIPFRICSLAFLVMSVMVLATSTVAADPIQKYIKRIPVPKKALLIGIGKYTHHDDLPTPEIDAEKMAKALGDLGVSVTRAKGTTRAELFNEIQAFTGTLNEGDIALVYYSGHGFQYEGYNYIVPSSSPRCIEDSESVVYKNIPISYLLREVQKRKVAAFLMVLDACRNSPFKCAPTNPTPDGADAPLTTKVVRNKLGKSKGFASGVAARGSQPDPDTGRIYTSLLVAMAADIGQSAWTGNTPSKGSLFTRKLATRIDTPRATFHTVLQRVRKDVLEVSQDAQRPWNNDSTLGAIHFNPDSLNDANFEQDWRDTLAESLQSNVPDLARDYLIYFPDSPFSAMARQFLKDQKNAVSLGHVAVASSDKPMVVAMARRTTRSSSHRGRRGITPRGISTPGVPSSRLIPLEATEPTSYVTTTRRIRANGTTATGSPSTPAPAQIAQAKNERRTIYFESVPEPVSRSASSSSASLRVRAVDKHNVGSQKLDNYLRENKGTAPNQVPPPSPDVGVVVKMSPHMAGASNPGEANRMAFRQSLAIRKQLRLQGYDPKNIEVHVPRALTFGASPVRSRGGGRRSINRSDVQSHPLGTITFQKLDPARSQNK